MIDKPLTRRAALSLAGSVAFSALAGPAFAQDVRRRPGASMGPRLSAQDRLVVRCIRADRALQDLRHLTEKIGQRYRGTPGEKAAADYCADVLERYDYAVETPSFSVPDVTLAEITGAALTTKIHWGCRSAYGAPTGVRVTGRLLPLADAVAEQLPADIAGRFVLVRSAINVSDFVAVAQEREAVGVIVVAAPSAPPRHSQPADVYLRTPSTIPVIGIGQLQGDLIAAAAAASVEITVTTTAHTNLTSSNIIATRRERGRGRGHGRARKNVMVSAHYDSVVGTRGANDDGSGTVLVLELARALRNLPTRQNLQFALWGAEEIGLVGARDYVKGLSEPDRAALWGVFQNDMVGTNWEPAERYWVLSSDGRPNVVNAEVLAAGERLGYRSRMSAVTRRGSSDHQAFQEVGIASGNFSWRGVEAPSLLEPEYHSADDTIEDNISIERLTTAIEIIGLAAYNAARSW